MIRAFVGAGGKTSLIKKQANEYRMQGKKVFVTTTTHMLLEEDTLLTDHGETILAELERAGYVMAGQLEEGGSTGKITALSEETYRKVCAQADVVLVEADGSKHFPMKVPNGTEPVIVDNVDEIVVVCGLHAIGRKGKNACHRLELAKERLGIDLTEDTVVTAVHVQQLVRKGYVEPLKEAFPNATIRVSANYDEALCRASGNLPPLYYKAVKSLLEADVDVSLLQTEWFQSQPTLVICGGGHVATELAKMASMLDFRIKVIDDRPEFANRERFPFAEEVVCDSFANLEQYLEPNGYYCVLTRGHKDDYVCVQTILKHTYGYLGMIGSRKKVQQTMENLRLEGVSEEQLQPIFAPIGLPIGAVTPGEIAVSILAQMIREKNQKQQASASSELLQADEAGTLCIIIEKTGSAPRGVGSMMFVGKEQCIGSVGGGAVEFAVIEEARKRPQAMVKEYLLNQEESAQLGMICGGRNRVLFVPIFPN